MPDVVSRDLVMLPPVADDPIFAEELYGESSVDLEVLTEAAAEMPSRPGSDPHDFAALFMRHRWSFALHARRFLHDERDVDEVVQEGFLRLFLAMPELETELQALAYCRRTITNLCIDRYRADQRRPRLLDLEAIPEGVLPDDEDIDPIVQAEDAAIVRQALAMLSPIHRAALLKREVEEKSLPQIAEELNITVEQTKHLLHRARRSLRRLLVGTHVEPGVDLDLATVLAANRERAARAAKPTGAAALALLLVLAGVLGIRQGGSRPSVVAGAGLAAPAGDLPFLRQVKPGPWRPHAAPRLAAPLRLVPERSHRSPGKDAGHSPSRLAPRAPGRQSVAVLPPATSPVVAPPVATPLVVIPPVVARPVVAPPVTPPLHDAYVVTGVGGSGSAQISSQQRALRASGTTSSSVISTSTESGTYALRQAFTFAQDGALVSVEVAETVPTPSGMAVETALQGSSTSSAVAADGTVHLVTSGSSGPVQVGASLELTRTVRLEVVLDADRLRVLSERVQVLGGVPEPAAVPSAAPPSAVQPPAPLAPQPTVGQESALPLGVQARVRRSIAVTGQEPARPALPNR